jgi:hypothetical protein
MSFSKPKPRLDLEYYSNLYISNFFNNKKILYNLLEDNNINYFIADKIWNLEHTNLNNNNYTYWTDGGLLWFYSLNKKKINYTEEELLSIIQCNLSFDYIFNDIYQLKKKTKKLYKIAIEIQNFIKTTLKIDTEIETTNFIFDTNFNFDNYNDVYEKNKKAFYNIKLIFKNDKNKILNNKTVVEFNLEYILPNNITNDIFDINSIKKNYINIPKNNTYKNNEKPLKLLKKLNRFNELGLMTYSYINGLKIDIYAGFNTEKMRQTYFIKHFLSSQTKFKKYFENLLTIYKNIFKDTIKYNNRFIQTVEELIYTNTINNYEKFISSINNYFIIKIRPALNTFINEINEELTKYNVKLFIVGGDAMRRYDNNISPTNDIDTKLYLKNISDDPDNFEKIKDKIMIILHDNIIKLRNYFEDNKENYYNELLLFQKEGLDFLTLKKNNIEFSVEELKNSYQHFSIHEHKKKTLDKFINLLSFGLRFYINVYDISNPNEPILLNRHNHLLQILDISIEDDYEFKKKYYIDKFGIPVASLEFLLKNTEKLYEYEDDALRRISNFKYIKDIKRYNRLYDIYSSNIEAIDEYADVKKLNGLSNDIMELINKYKKSIAFELYDFILIKKLLKNPEKLKEISKYPILLKFFTDISESNINLPNENINEIDNNYKKYNFRNSKNPIILKYLKLAKKFNKDNNNTFFLKNLNEIIKSIIPKPNDKKLNKKLYKKMNKKL